MLDPKMQPRPNLAYKSFMEFQIDTTFASNRDGQRTIDDFQDRPRLPLSSPHTLTKFQNKVDDVEITGRFLPEEENSVSTEASTTGTGATNTQGTQYKEVTICKQTQNSSLEIFMTAFTARSQKSRFMEHTISMTSKLDLVSDFENPIDAIFALSEWVTGEADDCEVSSCFATQNNEYPRVSIFLVVLLVGFKIFKVIVSISLVGTDTN